MKRWYFLVIAIILCLSVNASAQNPDSIIGQWYTQEGTSAVEIYKCENLYCGKIVWLKNPKNEEGNEKVDTKNPDVKMRDRRLMGLSILSGFKYKGDDTWTDVKIYDPKNGKTYSCKMSLDGDKLNVRGYVGFSLLGRTAVWTRKQG